MLLTSALLLALVQNTNGTPADSLCARSYIFEAKGLSDLSADFVRTAEVAGVVAADARSAARRPADERFKRVCTDGFVPWLHALRAPSENGATFRWSLVGPIVEAGANTAYAVERNNGALWGGKGLNTQASAGIEVRWRGISAAFRPVVAYHTNGEFPIMAQKDTLRSPFTYAAHSLDWPQRFGDESFAVFDPGQSYVRVEALGAAAGLSTENLWWGPGRENAIIMSNTAPGFVHAFLRSVRPVNIGIGRLHVEGIWGKLHESDYFDTIEENDDQLLAGASLTWEPKWLRGLFLSLHRVFVYPDPDSVSAGDIVAPFFQTPIKKQLATPENPEAFKSDNQLASITARWVLPSAGFEAYAEWAKDDHNWDKWDILNEVEQAQGYSLGFVKVIKGRQQWFRLHGELTHLERPNTHVFRGGAIYYTHKDEVQGYTHRGQLLGAWIGPGSNSQLLGFDVYKSWGNAGGFIQRIIHDNDAYYRDYARAYTFHGHDAELVLGSQGALLQRQLGVTWRAAYSIRRNRNFIELGTCCNWDMKVDHNFALTLGLQAR